MRSCCFKCINISSSSVSRQVEDFQPRPCSTRFCSLLVAIWSIMAPQPDFDALSGLNFHTEMIHHALCMCVDNTLFSTFRRLYEGANYIISRFIISHHIVWFVFVMTDRTGCLHDVFKKNVHTRPGWCLSTRHCTKVSVQHLLLTAWNSKKSVVITIGIPIVFRPGDITHP